MATPGLPLGVARGAPARIRPSDIAEARGRGPPDGVRTPERLTATRVPAVAPLPSGEAGRRRPPGRGRKATSGRGGPRGAAVKAIVTRPVGAVQGGPPRRPKVRPRRVRGYRPEVEGTPPLPIVARQGVPPRVTVEGLRRAMARVSHPPPEGFARKAAAGVVAVAAGRVELAPVASPHRSPTRSATSSGFTATAVAGPVAGGAW